MYFHVFQKLDTLSALLKQRSGFEGAQYCVAAGANVMVFFLLSCGSHPSNNQWIKNREEEIFRKKHVQWKFLKGKNLLIRETMSAAWREDDGRRALSSLVIT